MKFRFSLEPVLKLRKHEEKTEQFKLGKALGKKVELQRARQNLVQQLKKMAVFLESQTTGHIMVWRRYYSFLEQQQKMISIYDKKIEEAEKQVQIQRARLTEVNKKTQTLEKLETKEKMQLIRHLEQLDQKANNEIAAQRFNRKRR